jgi:signal transduction histidine kinase
MVSHGLAAERPSLPAREAHLVLAVGLTIVAVAAMWAFSGAGGQTATGFGSDIIQLATMGLMGACAARAATRTAGRARVAWILVAATGASWFLGQVVWTGLTYFHHPWPAVITDTVMPLSYLMGTPMLVAATALLFGLGFNSPALLRRLFDSALVVAGVLVIIWISYLGGQYRALPSLHWITIAYTFIYPVGDAIMTTLMVTLLLVLPREWRLRTIPIALGVAAIVIADTLYAFAQTKGYYDATSKFVLLWMTGEVVLAFAATRAVEAPSLPLPTVNARPYGQAAMMPAVVAILASFFYVTLQGHLDPVLLAITTVTALIIAARHLLQVREMHSNARHLQRALQVERELKQKTQEVQSLRGQDEFKTQLLNLTAHELNTPISALGLQLHNLKRLLRGASSEHIDAAFVILDRNLARLAALVSNTLDVARLQNGKLKLYKEPTEVAPLLREVVEDFHELAHRRHVAIALDVAPGLKPNLDSGW